MVEKTFFQERIREASMLLNARLLPAETEKLIYEKIKDNYHNSDIDNALHKIMDGDDKLGYLPLLRWMNHYRSMRIEHYVNKKKKEEEDEVRAFWKSNGATEGDCGGGDCFKCSVQYCEIIKVESIEAIKQILNKESAVLDKIKILSEKFKGIGFEADIPKLQPF